MGDLALLYGIFAGLLVAAFAARVLAARRPARTLVWGVVAADLRRLAAGRRRPRRRRRARGAARRRARRGALAHAGRPGALPVAAGERRPGVRDRARAGLRARRVRRQRPVPHEHRLQARLPGVAAAGARRRLRAAVGGRAPAAARVAGVGGAPRPCCCCSASSTPTPAPTRARAASRAHRRSTGSSGCARPRRATRPRSTGCARTRPATRSCSRRWGTTTRPSATAASRPSPAARPCSAGPATSSSGTTSRAAAREDVRTLYTTDDLAQARELIARYGIDYVVYGPIERTTYGDAGLAKWDELGEKVFEREGTTIWRLDLAPLVEPLGHAARRVPRLARR